jgi:hypothetical protein
MRELPEKEKQEKKSWKGKAASNLRILLEAKSDGS